MSTSAVYHYHRYPHYSNYNSTTLSKSQHNLKLCLSENTPDMTTSESNNYATGTNSKRNPPQHALHYQTHSKDNHV